MRVITGTFKGRKVHTVSSVETRPTSDKVKEAAFHVMGPYFSGGHALDLFAGSGSLGIEAISRGVESVTFIDHSNEAIKTIRKNIRHLQIENNTNVYRNKAKRALEILANKQKKFDIIFIDPPYNSDEYETILKRIQELEVANEYCYVYLEHVPSKNFTYDEQFYKPFFTRHYSKEIAVTILQVDYR